MTAATLPSAISYVPNKDSETTIALRDFPVPATPLADSDFSRHINDLWALSVEDANQDQGVTSLEDRFRQAYLEFCTRLVHFASNQHCELVSLRNADPSTLDEWRDSLIDKAEVTCSWYTETHRGPYVPGGSYREQLCRYTAEERVLIDISEMESKEIPESVDARYHGFNFDVDVQFTLVEVHPAANGRGMIAEFKVTIDD